MEREAYVAGSFYAADASQLRQQLKQLWPATTTEKQAAVGVMVPHAGYAYSGRTAAQVYARLAPVEVYLLVGPNHSGQGQRIAISEATAWRTPLGAVPIDRELSRRIVEDYPKAAWDDRAHQREHSLEVQLPFLQSSGEPSRIVAIALRIYELDELRELGNALARVIRACGKRCLLVASSDMNHFENLERTQALDKLALAQVLNLNPAGLMATVQQHRISMCGAAPVAVMLQAAQQLGAVAAECVHYATSAEASEDSHRVVGYAGVIVK